MRLIRRVVLGLVVVVVLAVGGLWLMLDSIAKKGIQQGGQTALGVATDVETVKFSLLNGSLRIDDLKVGNPEGFTSPYMVKTGAFDVAVKPSSILSAPIVVEKFILDGLELNLEQAGTKNNVSIVLDHVKQMGGQPAQGQAPAEAQKPAAPSGHEQHAAGGGQDEGTRLVVSRIVIKNVVGHVYLPAGKPLTVKVPEIVMENVTSDNAAGITTRALVARIFPAVVAAVLESGKGVIPADMAGLLQGDLAGISSNLGGTAANLIKQAGGGQLPALPGLGLGGAASPNRPAGGLAIPKVSLPAWPGGADPAATPAPGAAAPAPSPAPVVDAPKALDGALKGLLAPTTKPAK